MIMNDSRYILQLITWGCYLKKNQELWVFDQFWAVSFLVASCQGLLMEQPSQPEVFSEVRVVT